MEWTASPELMAKIQASIKPVRTDATLRKVLAADYPRDCTDLPISGGWGYTQSDAIAFIRDQFPNPTRVDFVSMEYHIVHKIIYEELIVFRPKAYQFSGINVELSLQQLAQANQKKFDHLTFSITCWSDWHWEQLKKEWEDNDLGKRPGFDVNAHAAKRNASQVKYERDFWFDITDVVDRMRA